MAPQSYFAVVRLLATSSKAEKKITLNPGTSSSDFSEKIQGKDRSFDLGSPRSSSSYLHHLYPLEPVQGPKREN